MGADGHIRIWRDDEARAAFPDCDRLFNVLPTHYVDTLDGVKYHHCYVGDNLCVYWNEIGDCYVGFGGVTKEELEPFIGWLKRHGESWEVWT